MIAAAPAGPGPLAGCIANIAGTVGMTQQAGGSIRRFTGKSGILAGVISQPIQQALVDVVKTAIGHDQNKVAG